MNDTIDDGDELENDGRVNYRKTPFPWFGGKSQAEQGRLFDGD